MNAFLWRTGVPVVALVAGVIGLAQVASLMLVISPVVTVPLMMAVGGMFAALGAAWAGNILAPDRSGSRLLPIVGAAEAAALLLAVAILGLAVVLDPAGSSAPDPLFPILAVSVLILTTGASLATWRFRYQERRLGRDALATVGLFAATVVVIVVAIVLSFALGLVGS